MIVCPACGQENPAGARFCNACATALPAEAPTAREERKVVTVLFADLVGFTSRSEQLDPEDVRGILAAYHARVRDELERHGGTVEKFIGDAVMALFGAPIAHEDDPERAVRAALAIRDELAEPNARDGSRQLHVRTGITTGEALVNLAARPQAGEGMAAGDVVNTAARLQSAAPVDGILVDETTYRATDRVIAYRPAGPIEAKGKAEPIPVWEALEARARFGVDVARSARTPLVGREHEVDVLRDALARMRRERSPQLVTLVGVPGIGKSRLLLELFGVVEEDAEIIHWRQGRSLPYGEGISYWALGEMVKAQAGILETDADAAAEAKLAEAVQRLLPDADDAPWVERHLRPLVGLGRADAGAAAAAEEAFAAWRRFFEALADSRPTVLVFEDLHWADDALLDFVEYLVDWAGGVPLLVVCTARPELLARRAGWGGGKPNATTLSLGPLSSDETARLIAELLDRAVIPAEIQSTLLARAGGNPLYAEEFVRMAAERGLDANLEHLPLPESVHGMIAARLDGLSSDDKELLQDAAVVGKVFWLGAVAAISGRGRWDVERCLHELERRQFVRRERRSSVGGEVEYAFWHALVRDVAYGQIPRARRAEKHRLAAEWIGSLTADRADDHADLLAHHYGSALEFARAAGQDTTPLETPARAALRSAAERALSLSAFEAAARYFEQALALWPADDDERPYVLFGYARALFNGLDRGRDELREARDGLLARGDVERAAQAETILGEEAWSRGRPRDTIEHLRRANEMLEGRPPSSEKAYVLGNQSRYLMLAGRSDDAIATGREALAMAEAYGLDELRAHALNNIGVSRVALGDPDGVGDLEDSIRIAEALSSPEAIRGYINLASVTAGIGDMRRCHELHRRGLELAERFGQVRGIRFLSAELGLDAYTLGDWDEAVRRADALLAEVESGSPHYMESGVRSIRATILGARGDMTRALSEMSRALEHARELGEPQVVLPTLAAAAVLFVDAGNEQESAAILDKLSGETEYESVWFWAVPGVFAYERLGRTAEVLAAVTGDAARTSRWVEAAGLYAQRDFAVAADALEEIGSLPDAARARVRAAEELVAAGRRAEADVQLGRALAFYRAVGATRHLHAAEALLAASA